jgi:hypothetical protein
MWSPMSMLDELVLEKTLEAWERLDALLEDRRRQSDEAWNAYLERRRNGNGMVPPA